MAKWLVLLALALWMGRGTPQQALEELMRSVVIIYLLIVGFLVIIMREKAWKFLQPLFVVGLMLLFLPPLCAYLARSATSSLGLTFGLPVILLGSTWVLVPMAALVVFILFRLSLWCRRRPARARREIHRERERVLPAFDVDEDSERP